MTDEAQPLAVKPIVEALFHAGIARPRMKPQMDLSVFAFLADDYFLRYGLFPNEPVPELPKRSMLIVPERFDLAARDMKLLVPEGRA